MARSRVFAVLVALPASLHCGTKREQTEVACRTDPSVLTRKNEKRSLGLVCPARPRLRLDGRWLSRLQKTSYSLHWSDTLFFSARVTALARIMGQFDRLD